jgi:hypothetical protein
MRRIALLAFVLLTLPAAAAQATVTECDPVLSFHGKDAVGIREQNMGCHWAHQMAKHVIVHGSGAGLHHYTCRSSALPKNVTEWQCSHVTHGDVWRVTFGVRPAVGPPATPEPAETPCDDVHHNGFVARHIRELNMGCPAARSVARHVIEHGNSGYEHITCTQLLASETHALLIWTCRNGSAHVRWLMRAHGGQRRAVVASVQECHDITHHNQDAVGFREQNMGCDSAHAMARHIIDHGTAGFHQYTCSRSFLPHNVTEWECSATIHGEKMKVVFGVRPAHYAAIEPTAPVVVCASVPAYGFRAQSIRERGLGCHEAHTIARYVVLHGYSDRINVRCRATYPNEVPHWSCDGQSGGKGVSLTFYLVQTDPNVA